MNLTREEAIRQHRKMWHWIADKLKGEEVKSHLFVTGYKKEYIETYFPGMDINSYCFLCEYSNNQRKTDDECKCDYCPLKWGDLEDDDCMVIGEGGTERGLYGKAIFTSETNYLVYLCEKIAELSEREEENV